MGIEFLAVSRYKPKPWGYAGSKHLAKQFHQLYPGLIRYHFSKLGTILRHLSRAVFRHLSGTILWYL